MVEKRFAFRDRLTASNKPFRVQKRVCLPDETSVADGVTVECPENIVCGRAIADFYDFLKVCFGITEAKENAIKIKIDINSAGLGDVCGYKGRITEVKKDVINILAYDERGAAQALYDLEDAMRVAGVPFLKQGKTRNKPLFSPRMAHSAYDLDVFPEGYMQNLAKEGIDALLVFVSGINKTPCFTADFNGFIEKANSYGLDVYAYCNVSTFMHPESPGAEEEYYNVYGKIFEAHPKFKGMVFVGESCEFASKDERTTGRRHTQFLDKDNLVDPKPAPGWWPCRDFPLWLERVKSAIRRASPKADIVFWTYNWGWAPESERIRLLNEIPTDISLLVTFEMFENLPTAYGITERVCDYSIAFAGPGRYFVSEAEIAKKRGIRLYAMCNAGGRTWDFGVIPYEPFPQQWLARFEKLRECHDKYGLTGLMESHHYGYTPSFITKIAGKKFEMFADSSENILRGVIDEFSSGQTEQCIKAFEFWCRAIRIYMPTDEEQYCAMRVGPAYPLILGMYVKPPKLFAEKVRYESSITEEYHSQSGRSSAEGKFTLHSIRLPVEIKMLREAIGYMRQGLAIFKKIDKKTEELRSIINLGEYIICCFETDINVKKFYKLKTEILIAHTRERVKTIIGQIKKVAKKELQNASRALKCVDFDSAIGYEPSMGYGGDRAHIEWKIKQVNHMLDNELAVYEKGLGF